jgi:hypothetical protein
MYQDRLEPWLEIASSFEVGHEISSKARLSDLDCYIQYGCQTSGTDLVIEIHLESKTMVQQRLSSRYSDRPWKLLPPKSMIAKHFHTFHRPRLNPVSWSKSDASIAKCFCVDLKSSGVRRFIALPAGLPGGYALLNLQSPKLVPNFRR